VPRSSDEPLEVINMPGKRAISNEVGRCKRFFSGCWPAQETPVR